MRLLLTTLLVFALACGTASAHRLGKWSPGYGNVVNAIYYEFCGKRYVRCWEGDQAMRVANCETGGTYSVWASNGQYKGLFQMGSSERDDWGHAWNPWGQARAANRYFVASGKDWSPWACKP